MTYTWGEAAYEKGAQGECTKEAWKSQMNTNDKQKEIINELLKRTVEIREKVEASAGNLSYKNGLVKTLVDIEGILSNLPVDLKRLGKNEFGIFRMVTDSSALENSSLGKELLSLLESFNALHEVLK